MEKDLDIVVHESKEKTEETGLETVELSNEGKSAWFNLKDTAILQVIHLHKIKRVFMGVFLSLSRTWIFKIESDALPMCWGPRATKNLDKRACIQTFPQSPQSSFTVIHPINATQQGCSFIRVVQEIYLWFDVTTTLCHPFYPFGFVAYTSQVQILFSTHPSRCHKPLKQPVDNVEINL